MNLFQRNGQLVRVSFSLPVLSSGLSSCICLAKEEQKIAFRFLPSWTLFEPRCTDQQLLVTSYRQSLAGVLMYSSVTLALRLRTFVYYSKIFKVFIFTEGFT